MKVYIYLFCILAAFSLAVRTNKLKNDPSQPIRDEIIRTIEKFKNNPLKTIEDYESFMKYAEKALPQLKKLKKIYKSQKQTDFLKQTERIEATQKDTVKTAKKDLQTLKKQQKKKKGGFSLFH